MNVIKYKYYITYHYISTVDTIEVHPLGVDKLKIQYRGTEGQVFKRRFLNGSLVFINQPKNGWTDYTLFKNIDSSIYDKCSEISLEIKRSCDNGATYEDDFWNGYFSVTDGEFDLDKCIFTVECQPDDEYRCFVENKELEMPLTDVPNSADVLATVVTQYEFFTCTDTLGNCNALRPGPEAASTWLIFHQEVCEGQQFYIYYREVAVVACQGADAIAPSGSGWYQDTINYGDCTNGLSRWVRIPQTVVTNNPNPDVWSGNCDPNDTPPPKKVYLGVIKQSTATTPVIVGKSTVYDNTLGAHSEFYYIKYPKPNATYLWSVTGAGISIVGSATGTSVEVSINFSGAGRSVDVIETTSCGASATISQVLTTCNTGGCAEYNADAEIIGNSEICIGETAYYYFNAATGRSAIVSGGTGTATFNSIDNKTFELTGLTEGTIVVTWNGGGTTDSLTMTGITVTVKIKKSIEPIYGDTTVCNDSQAYYSIPDTDLGGFVWEVDGGTITSGQGTNEILVTWDGNNGVGFVYVSQDFNCGCNWIQIAACEPGLCSWWWCPSDTMYTINNNHTFKDVVNQVRQTICERTLDIKSDFFEWNPPGDTPGYVAGTNYVTGETNHLPYISLLPLREVVYGFTGNGAFANPTIDEVITWQQIEEIFRESFNAYWFIDTNGNLRVEHESWFNRVVTYDLTDAYYNKFSVGKNKYSYDKIKAPKIERFKWKSAIGTDFIGADITYSGTCTTNEPSQMVSNRGLSYVQTDLYNLVTLGTSAGRDGFVLLDTMNLFVVQSDYGKISGLLLTNAHLSWANLHYNYHRHGRVLLNGMMNLESTIFLSARRYKKQEEVSFPFCCNDAINPLQDLITTLVGNGVIDEAEHDFKTDEIKVNLLHDF